VAARETTLLEADVEMGLDELGNFVVTAAELAGGVASALGGTEDAGAIDRVRLLLVEAAQLVAEVKTRRRGDHDGGASGT
jgi:hypothetical protein